MAEKELDLYESVNNGIPKPNVLFRITWKKGRFKELVRKVKKILSD